MTELLDFSCVYVLSFRGCMGILGIVRVWGLETS